MDNMILGLLLFSGRTIYQLRERIGKGLNLMYSDSMGSIQAAVKKLLNSGCIQYEETVENGKYKKIYSITDRGRQRFDGWIHTPMSVHSGKNPELAKLYFLGLSENPTQMLESYLAQLKEQYRALDAICKDGENSPYAQQRIGFYQLASARFGRDFMQFQIEWYQKLLEQAGREKA